MSLVEYSPEMHDLITVSLHHFEDDTIREGFVHNETIPIVRVDPESRWLGFFGPSCYFILHKHSLPWKVFFNDFLRLNPGLGLYTGRIQNFCVAVFANAQRL